MENPFTAEAERQFKFDVAESAKKFTTEAKEPTAPTLVNKEQALKEYKEKMGLRPEGETYLEKAQRLTFDFIKERLEKTDTHITFEVDEVYVVWFSKTLQNWKALLSTTLPDGMYYEVTYNGDMKETYIDAYKKFENVKVPD